MESTEYGLARHWWVLALRGVLAIAFGVLAFLDPGVFWLALVIVFAASALVDGVASIAAAVSRGGRAGPWWALLLRGLLGIAAGVIAIVWPGISELALYFVIAGWCFATGVFEVAAAIEASRYVRGAWIFAISGILSVALGLMLGLFPLAGLVVLAWWVGAFAVAFGIVLIALGFRLRGLAWHAAGPEFATRHGHPSGAVGA